MIRKLEKREWEAFFDAASARATAQTVDVEVLSADVGALPQVRAVPLVGLCYDPRDDALDVATQDLEHRIADPAEIHVDEDPGGLQSVLVTLADGSKQILRFAPVLALPAAQPGRG